MPVAECDWIVSVIPCAQCLGTGWRYAAVCPHCGGSGEQEYEGPPLLK